MVNTQQHSDSNNNQSKLFMTESCSSVAVELASPWRRIAAYLINNAIYYFIIFIGLRIYNATFDFESEALGQNIVLPFELWFLSDYRSTEPVSSILGLLFVSEKTHDLSSIFLYIILPVAIFALWQTIQMSITGQSIGKRLMGIKVIGIYGQNPGFIGTVLLREISFQMILHIIVILVVIFVKPSELFDGRVFNFPLLAIFCLLMLFLKNINYRTLQDYLAKTIVIKAEK
ncbi:RDD family protein [Snodgrassella sp. ESL0253]|uniref:RDD family protein n=1 Tax=Snodgrassella sp. ESL0253 TaxID=2705031 RepID=UPI0015819B1F|nr:RDD family protein [Snodgrassella sp. ESL0253]NUE67299.1 RDD family protein [Snodgrassella sp. ESL0253]